MSGKMVLLAIGFLFVFAAGAYGADGFIIELKNGNLIGADSCRVVGGKLVLSYPLGNASIELGSVKRVLKTPSGGGRFFREKGRPCGLLYGRYGPDEAATASGEPVEIWDADEKEREHARLIEKMAEAEANGGLSDTGRSGGVTDEAR